MASTVMSKLTSRLGQFRLLGAAAAANSFSHPAAKTAKAQSVHPPPPLFAAATELTAFGLTTRRGIRSSSVKPPGGHAGQRDYHAGDRDFEKISPEQDVMDRIEEEELAKTKGESETETHPLTRRP